MNRLMLVEDEPLERQALKMELERGEYGISGIYEAANGQEALEIFEAEHPDILIVDINIPVLSGLELIEKVVESGAACKILITTTYDRSRYVRTAISLGVTDYLLKPVDYAELKNAIEKCRLLLMEERRQTRKFEQLYSYTQHHMLEDLLSGALDWHDGEMADIMDLGPGEQLCASLVISNTENDHFEQELKKLFVPEFAVLTARIDRREVALIHPRGVNARGHAIARTRAYVRVLFRNLSVYGDLSLVCCEPESRFIELKESYARMCKDLERGNETGLRLPAMPTGGLCQPSEKQRLGQKWLNKLYQRDADRLIRSIRRRMLQDDAYWEGADLFCSIFDKMDGSANLADLFKCFEREKPYEALRQFLSYYYIGHIPELENSMGERILSVMQRDFMKDITQADVAEELGMSPSYFSTLFKKEMGNSFTDTLNSMRIDHAAKLMDNGETDVDKIAAGCGFTNRKYFLQVFRKRMKKTVAEYMEDRKK